MKIAIHAFCISSTLGEECFRQNESYSPEKLPTHAVGVRIGMPAREVVDLILHGVGNSQVQVLRTVAHGDYGYYEFPHLYMEDMISLEYARLKKIWAPNARFEMHGCGLASETSILRKGVAARDAKSHNTVKGTFSGRSDGKGLRYLRRVASTVGAQVVAGVNVQEAPPNSFGFEGDTVTVVPNGKFRYDSEGTRGWDIEAINREAMRWLDTIEELYIEPGRISEGRLKLKELIAKYPQTWAAKYARERLETRDLKRAPSQQLPDGSWTF
jgi:hypothetical protein